MKIIKKPNQKHGALMQCKMCNKIINLLKKKELRTSEIAKIVGLSSSSVLSHLRQLTYYRIIKSTFLRDGRKNYKLWIFNKNKLKKRIM